MKDSPPQDSTSKGRWVVWRMTPIWARTFLLSTVLAMVLIAGADQALSEKLARLEWTSFAAIQDRSLFEDGTLGGSDIGLFLQVLSVLALCYHLKASKPKLYEQSWQRFNAAVAMSFLHVGVVVQGLKFSWARARPYVVGSEPGGFDLYSPWYQFGKLSLRSENFNGSFPSGHSAAAAAFFAFAFYIPVRYRYSFRAQFFYRLVTLVFAFFFWGAMVIARPMSRAHYLTDCLASGVLVVSSLVLFTQIFDFTGPNLSSSLNICNQPFRRSGKVFLYTLLSLLMIFLTRLTL